MADATEGFAYRRVKNDEREAADLADLLRMHRLPAAYLAPPEVFALRETVRHRAKLVTVRSGLKAQVHAVLAKEGVRVGVSDLFGVGGRELLAAAPRDRPIPCARVLSLLRLIDTFDFEIDLVSRRQARQLADHLGYRAVQALPGVGPVLAAVFVAELGDVSRFPGPQQLTCWAGLTPRHRESDLTVRRGAITKQGSRLVRCAVIEAVQRTTRPEWLARQRWSSPPAAAGTSPPSRPQAAHARLLRTARRADPRAVRPRGGVSRLERGRARGRAVS